MLLLVLVAAIFAVVMPLSGLYRRPWAGTIQMWWPVLRATAVGVVMAVTITYFLRPYGFSRSVFIIFFVQVSALFLIYRPIVRRMWLKAHRLRAGDGVLIVGIEELGRLVAEKIRMHPELGLRLAGFLTRRPEMVGRRVDGLPVLGLYEDIHKVLTEEEIQGVIIALPLEAHDRIEEILAGVGDEMVDIRIVPDLVRYVSLRGSVEEFEGLPIIGVRGTPMEGWARVVKRVIDLTGGGLGLLIFGLPMLVLAAAIKLESRGPVFYRQRRMGLDGQVFNMLKFRSMREGAEEETGPVWACKEDPRCTRVGTFIRRMSLDELPQFINVLKGEMSLVGPRPERPEFITQFRRMVPGYMLRHKVKAGITGWAQINGWRGNTSLERRIEHDLFYIENWSLGFDLRILATTLLVGFYHPNAY